MLENLAYIAQRFLFRPYAPTGTQRLDDDDCPEGSMWGGSGENEVHLCFIVFRLLAMIIHVHISLCKFADNVPGFDHT